MTYDWMRQFLVDLDIATIRSRDNPEHIGEMWKEVFGDRKWEIIYHASCGMGDSQYAMIFFEDGTVEVGTGEALRPYTQLYIGKEAKVAWRVFVKALSTYFWKETKGEVK